VDLCASKLIGEFCTWRAEVVHRVGMLYVSLPLHSSSCDKSQRSCQLGAARKVRGDARIGQCRPAWVHWSAANEVCMHFVYQICSMVDSFHTLHILCYARTAFFMRHFPSLERHVYGRNYLPRQHRPTSCAVSSLAMNRVDTFATQRNGSLRQLLSAYLTYKDGNNSQCSGGL